MITALLQFCGTVRYLAKKTVAALHLKLICLLFWGNGGLSKATLPETNSSHLKKNGIPKGNESSSKHQFSGVNLLLVSERVVIFRLFCSHVLVWQLALTLASSFSGSSGAPPENHRRSQELEPHDGWRQREFFYKWTKSNKKLAMRLKSF